MTASVDEINAQRAEERHRILRAIIDKMVAEVRVGPWHRHSSVVIPEYARGRIETLAEVAGDLMVTKRPTQHIIEAVLAAVAEVPPTSTANGGHAAWTMARTRKVLSDLGEAI